MLTAIMRAKSPRTKPSLPKKSISLSTYFPKGTHYFYGYPAGEDSGFLNLVPPSVEELVAVRAVSCAGEHVSVVGFASTHYPSISKELLYKLNVPQIKRGQLVLLPDYVNTELIGAERNRVIKESLKTLISDNKLVMAQPYTSRDMNTIYQIPSKLIRYLNEKHHMSQYIDNSMIPTRLATFTSGQDFKNGVPEIPFPYVVKASSSSCGDGVYICARKADLKKAITNLKEVKGSIIVEQYIVAEKNYGIHFGIPSDNTKQIDFLGFNEQITTSEGEFIGGKINNSSLPDELIEIRRYLLNEVLPLVRNMGWYGVGGFDVLRDSKGKCYFIDCNFRMTGMSAYHFLVANKALTAPLISFSGEIEGAQEYLEEVLLPYAGRHSKDRTMQIIAISQHDNVWSFNAALSYTSEEHLQYQMQSLLKSGVKSKALDHLLG